MLRLRFEKLYFSILRIFVKLTSLFTFFPIQQKEYLSYQELISLNRKSNPSPKSTVKAYKEQQEKWHKRISQLTPKNESHRILEVGCGTGWIAHLFSQNQQSIYANDIVLNLYPEVDRSGIKLALGDAGRLPYCNNAFDLVYSINSFEHFEHPESILDEMIRVLRPGGVIFIAFNPLYYSPWGLHAARRLGMAYPQLLFSKETIQKYLDENRESLTKTYDNPAMNKTIGPFVNEFSIEQYRSIFTERNGQLMALGNVETLSFDGVRMIMKYPGLIKSKVPSIDNLFVSGIKYIGQKI
ncbi:MAG TPA: class I SAM-dependent methyltransferase [Longilinea sp.]|nr:class I SAM-dependent methyltransferase [Longilinea sp.]